MESEPTTELAAPEPAAPAEPTPRLMIKSMILENFKSYAGPQEIGPFDKNMSSVVGPNGSGKSNVIDAMLFVFGFRACLLYTSPSPRDQRGSRMPSSA